MEMQFNYMIVNTTIQMIKLRDLIKKFISKIEKKKIKKFKKINSKKKKHKLLKKTIKN